MMLDERIYLCKGSLLRCVWPPFPFNTAASFEQSVAEIYTTVLEGHLQVALEVLEVGICSSL
jgi:hypothetical protein